jgi:hypothetical protein
LYILTTGYDLLGDDLILIGGNPYVRSFHFLREIFTQNFWSFRGPHAGSIHYRPLLMLTFLGQATVFGSRPGLYHLFNVLLNAWLTSNPATALAQSRRLKRPSSWTRRTRRCGWP